VSIGLQFIFLSFLKLICTHVHCSNANILPVDAPEIMLGNILVHQLKFWWVFVLCGFFFFFYLPYERFGH